MARKLKLEKYGWIKKKLDKLFVYKDGEKGNWYTEVMATRIQEKRNSKSNDER